VAVILTSYPHILHNRAPKREPVGGPCSYAQLAMYPIQIVLFIGILAQLCNGLAWNGSPPGFLTWSSSMNIRYIFVYPLFMFQGLSPRKTFVWLARNAAGMSRPAWPSSRSNPSLWSARCAAKSAATYRLRSSMGGLINWLGVRKWSAGVEVRFLCQRAPGQHRRVSVSRVLIFPNVRALCNLRHRDMEVLLFC
jgi:hypothetical protein